MRFYKRFLLLPLIIAVFSYLLYVSYKEVKDRTLDEFNDQQFALAKQASKGIESFFTYYQRELQFLTTLNYVSELNNQGRNLLEDFYKSHSDQIEAITLVNEKGILMYTFPYSKSAIGNDISSQEHIKTVLSTHKVTVSEVFTSIQGYKTIALHVPIINGTEYKGSLAILIPLNALGQQFIQSINTGVTGYGWMISKDGVALYSPFADQIGKSAKDLYNGNPSVLSLIDKASLEASGTSICYLSSKPDNIKDLTKTLTAYYRISLGNTFWTIIIFTPEIEIFRTLSSFRNRLYILFSIVIIVIIFYFFLSKQVQSFLRRKRVTEELISAKEKAEESDRLKSAFLTNMSHELRTPLNAIIGFSNLMIAADPENETTSYLRIIANSGQHLLGLVEDILDISMIEREEIKINYEKVGINSILYDVKNIIKGEILKENKDEIQLILNINPNISDIFIFTDSRRLKQVLINLLKNSLKFTDKGYIEFGFTVIKKDEADYFRFYVIDTGIGIEKKYHEIIFNNFRQIDDTNTRKYGGTGIGLSIARKIIEKLGGEIWVESEPGEGSVFYFTIPVLSEKRNPANLPIETAMITENDYKGKTILIAEDEITSFEFLRIYFTKMNIRVLWAKNGREAIDICEADPLINMVLMDIKMPQLNGYESARKIKKMLPGMPIIAQTAHAMQSEKEEALNSGCDDYLSKPIEMALLKDMLKKYLR